MFISQIDQQKFEQLAELLLKFSMISATYNLKLEKDVHHCTLPLNLAQFSKNNEQVKNPFTYKIK